MPGHMKAGHQWMTNVKAPRQQRAVANPTQKPPRIPASELILSVPSAAEFSKSVENTVPSGRPQSAHNTFLQALHKRHPGYAAAELTRKIAKAWGEMSTDEKQLWTDIYEDQLHKYLNAHPEQQLILAVPSAAEHSKTIHSTIPARRPRSAYHILFQAVLAQYPGCGVSVLASKVGKAWTEMLPHEKQLWQEIYEAQLSKYFNAHPDEQPPPSKKPRSEQPPPAKKPRSEQPPPAKKPRTSLRSGDDDDETHMYLHPRDVPLRRGHVVAVESSRYKPLHCSIWEAHQSNPGLIRAKCGSPLSDDSPPLTDPSLPTASELKPEVWLPFLLHFMHARNDVNLQLLGMNIVVQLAESQWRALSETEKALWMQVPVDKLAEPKPPMSAYDLFRTAWSSCYGQKDKGYKLVWKALGPMTAALWQELYEVDLQLHYANRPTELVNVRAPTISDHQPFSTWTPFARPVWVIFYAAFRSANQDLGLPKHVLRLRAKAMWKKMTRDDQVPWYNLYRLQGGAAPRASIRAPDLEDSETPALMGTGQQPSVPGNRHKAAVCPIW
ncbi:hypothetical protein C8F01DRAFT_1244891 [Mycena amicta]|nr:hypothetical protein C8F01DRAFT_1244891 [Mycena amicta]